MFRGLGFKLLERYGRATQRHEQHLSSDRDTRAVEPGR